MRCSLLLAFLLLAAIRNTSTSPAETRSSEATKEFRQWAKDFGKIYTNKYEEEIRFQIFQTNLEKINRYNSNENENTFAMGLNKFSDLTYEEFTFLYLGGPPYQEGEDPAHYPTVESLAARRYTVKGGDLASLADWASMTDCIAPVQDQKRCGSCYAFAATAAVEYYYCKNVNNGLLVKFSEQQIVDCSKWYTSPACPQCSYNNGCEGGFDHTTFNYLKYAGSFMPAQAYRYVARDNNRCFHNSKIAVPLRFASQTTTFVSLGESGNYSSVTDALTNIGPLVFSIYVNQDFYRYRSGVFSSSVGCSSKAYNNHMMLLVGYGTDPIHGDYWLAKNSWGSQWGESGYIRIARHPSLNICNMLNWVSFPNIESGSTLMKSSIFRIIMLSVITLAVILYNSRF